MKQTYLLLILLIQLSHIRATTPPYLENRDYDIFCLSYGTTDTDECEMCNYFDGQTPLSTWYTTWGQTCKKTASDYSCVKIYATITQQPGNTETPYTYCTPESSIPNGAANQKLYYSCSAGCLQCYSSDSGTINYTPTQSFNCMGCNSGLHRVVTSTTSSTSQGTGGQTSYYYNGVDCTRECQGHPTAKYVNTSVSDAAPTFGASTGPPGASSTISVCFDCSTTDNIALCAPDALTSQLKTYECSYTYKRFPNGFTDTSVFNGFTGALTSGDCAANRATSSLNLTFYVSPTFNPACETNGCDGTASKPYDDIYYVAWQLAYNNSRRITDFLESSVTIYLNEGTHYWMDTNSQGNPKHNYNMIIFHCYSVSDTLHSFLRPAACSSALEGQCDPSNTVTVKLKSHYISIFVSNYLSIENIVFDSSDLSYPVNSSCWYNRLECCTYDSDSGTYIPTAEASTASPGYLCDDIGVDNAMNAARAPGASVQYDPAYTVVQPTAFINTKFLKDYSKTRYPRIALYNTKIVNFYNYNEYSSYLSFIHVDLFSGHITLSNVTVTNYFFPRGFISNFGNNYEDPTKERIYTCKDASTTTEDDSTDCYSLTIKNSAFSYYNKQLYKVIYGSVRKEATTGQGNTSSTTTSWNINTIIQEGAVVNLQSFDGVISITNTTFENSVTAAHDSSLKSTTASGYIAAHNCYEYTVSTGTGGQPASSSSLSYDTNSAIKIQLDRHMRKHWSVDSTRSGSLINIRYLSKGLILYNNTFDANIGHTGSALYINEFRDTKTYPVIIDSNNFTNNFAYLFGLTIVMFKNGSSYMANECHGISLTNNQFLNNMGCANTFGNVLIVCDCSAVPSPTPSGNSTTYGYEQTAFWSPTYTFALDNEGTSSNIANANFTSYMFYMKSKATTPTYYTNPIDGSSIDLYRITVSNNLFEGNLASGSNGLYIQGSFRVSIQDNNFTKNAYYHAGYYDHSDYSSNAWKKLIASRGSSSLPTIPYTTSAALGTTSNVIVTLGSFIDLTNNYFDSSYTGNHLAARYFGSAVTFYLTIAYGNITIADCMFKNSQRTGYPNQESLTYQIQPIISFSLYESFFDILNSAANYLLAVQQVVAGKTTGALLEVNETISFWKRNGYYSDITVKNMTVTDFEWGSEVTQTYTEYTKLPSSFATLFQFFISSQVKESITDSSTFTSDSSHFYRPIPAVRLYINDSEFTHLTDNSIGCLFTQSYNALTSMDNIVFQNNKHSDGTGDFPTSVGYPGFFCQFPPSTQATQNPGTKNGPLYQNKYPLTVLALSNFTYKENYGVLLSGSYYSDTTYNVLDSWTIESSSVSDTSLGSTLISLYYPLLTINNVTIDGFIGSVLSVASGTAYLQTSTIQNCKNFGVALMYASAATITLQDTTIYNNYNTTVTADHSSGCDGSMICSSGASTVNINNSTILSNNFSVTIAGTASTFSLTVSSSNISNNNFHSSFVYSGGWVTMSESNFTENTVVLALIYLSSSANLAVFSSNFTKNYCAGCMANIFYVKSLDSFYVTDSYFTYNDATDSGAIEPITTIGDDQPSILMSTATDLQFSSSVFQYNKGNSKYLFRVQLGSLQISDSTFEHNYGTGSNGIDLISASLSLSNSVFTNNTAYKTCQLFSLAVSTTPSTVTNTIFQNSVIPADASPGPSYSYFKILNSDITFTGCTFQHSKSTVSAIYADAMRYKVKFDSCTFTNNSGTSSTVSAGAVTGNAPYVFTSCTFSNNVGTKGSHLYIASSNGVTITSSTFNMHTGDAIYLSSTKYLILTGSSFTGISTETGSRGLYLLDVTTSTISSTQFSYHNCKFTNGSGILIESSTTTSQTHTLSSCTFDNNQADYGGGLGIQATYFNVTVDSSTFTSNSANSKGGAISLTSTYLYSFLTISGTSSFSKNSAVYAGGAIFVFGQPAKFSGSAYSFSSNIAAYGNNIGSYPTTMKRYVVGTYNESLGVSQYYANLSTYTYTPGSRLLEESSKSRLLEDDDTNITLASGKQLTPPLVFALYDEYGQLYLIDNSSTLSVTAKSNSKGTPFFSEKTSFTAELGIFELTNFIVILEVNTSTDFTFKTNAFASNPTRNDVSYSTSLTFDVTFRSCVRGERLTLDGQCLDCPEGKYLFNPNEVLSCQECFDNYTNCYGGDVVGPTVGYWRFSASTESSIECPFDGACLGNMLTENQSEYYCASKYNESFCQTGWCDKIYTGNLCNECIPGYTKTSSACIDCSGTVYKVIISLAIPLYVIFIIITVRNAIKDDPKKVEELKEKGTNLVSILMKVFINYFQLVGIVSSFDFNWSDSVDTVTTTSSTASSSITTLLNPDCIGFASIDFSDFPIDRFFLGLLFLTLAPIGIFIFAFVLWHFIYLTKYRKIRKTPEAIKRRNSKIATTIIVLMFMVYSDIVTTSIYSFQCENIADDINPRYFLVKNYQIECWQGKHNLFAFAIGLPSLLIWGFGIPLGVILYLRKNLKRLHDPEFKEKYGFLYEGYRIPQRFYWEVVILYRKVLFILATVFLGTYSVDVQGLCVLGIAFTNFVLHRKMMPFEHKILNDLEQASLFVSSITIYCGLFFQAGVSGLGLTITILIVMGVSNGYFLVYWAIAYTREFIKHHQIKEKWQKFKENRAAKKRAKMLKKQGITEDPNAAAEEEKKQEENAGITVELKEFSKAPSAVNDDQRKSEPELGEDESPMTDKFEKRGLEQSDIGINLINKVDLAIDKENPEKSRFSPGKRR